MFEIITHKRGKEVFRKERKNIIDSIVIHHTWSHSIDNCIDHWKSNKCGTHYIIERDGKIYCIVSPIYTVYHCVSMNERSIGIDLMRGKGQTITDEQYESLNKLIQYLSGVYNIDCELHKKGLLFHCDVRKTQCPRPIKDEKIYGYSSSNNNL